MAQEAGTPAAPSLPPVETTFPPVEEDVADAVRSRFEILEIGPPPASSGLTLALRPDSTGHSLILLVAGQLEPWNLNGQLRTEAGGILQHGPISSRGLYIPGAGLTAGKYYLCVIPGQKPKVPWPPFQFEILVTD